ncbi:response regulator [Microvirga terrae]|uniref:Response regulator n=1 Tax=Microvirga terrae TaxID=2740529 RepID=A0ABY5RTI8_9HYPH|nr:MULTISPECIES: response regulator [Microvirga]MBQ0823311.1 response regulator [Microvirga sp. HBU67558]UVF20561.1 response regulator [Microvirga terrae]
MSSEKPLRILVVEDEILIALELESLLQDLGHDVVAIAASSGEALARGRELKPDLAFVDIHLADGPTGVDVARRLAAELQVTVLFMTANTKRIPEDFAGAWGVIAKPYTERGVREALGYVTAGQLREPDDARTVTFVPFGAAPRERNSQVS